MVNIQQTIVLGVVSSIIASIVFYLWMILIKPRFIISDKMSMSEEDDDNVYYMVKIANTTHAFLTNISYSLIYCVEGEDGLKDIRTVEPLKTPIKHMNAYTTKNTDYAVRITYKLKKDEYPLDASTFFMFTFQAYHSFSNAMKIKKKIYRKNDIQKGIFETGRSTKILCHR